MSISELSNAPIEITLGGRKLKIQRLSLSEIFTPAETKVKEDYLASVEAMAKMLTGKEKLDFLSASRDGMPSGAKLNEKAMEYMNSPIGTAHTLLLGLNKCQEISELEITDLMLKCNQEEINNLRAYINGNESDSSVTDEKKRILKLAESVIPQTIQQEI